jgi:hypothetical protein
METIMAKYLLSIEEKNLIEPIFSNTSSRSQILFQFGQKFLKNLDGISLQEKTYGLFEYLLEKIDNWAGTLLIPESYRHDKSLKINYINYVIREFIGWSILYPKEVDTYFEVKNDGNIIPKENPVIRLVDKDKYKLVKKVVNGKNMSVKAKKETDKKLKSGFTLSQKDDILNVVIACFVEVNTVKNKFNEDSI